MSLKEYLINRMHKPYSGMWLVCIVGALSLFICTLGYTYGQSFTEGTLEYVEHQNIIWKGISAACIFSLLGLHYSDKDDLIELDERLQKLEEEEKNGED